MKFDWSSLFLFNGLASCLISLIVIHIVFREHKKIYFFLLILLLSFSVILVERIVRFSTLFYLFPQLLFISSPFILSIYPLTYLFQTSLIDKNKRWYMHILIPFLSFFLLPSFIMSSTDKLSMYAEGSNDPWWFTTLFIIYATSYCYKILNNTKTNESYLRSFYSDSRVENHLIINRFLSICSVLYLFIPIGLSIVYLDIDSSSGLFIRKMLYTGFSFAPSLLMLSFFLPNESFQFIDDKVNDKNHVNYSSHLEFEELKRFMEEQQPFLDQNLTLETLAHKTEMNRTELSKLINTESKNNFYDFVNNYRIKCFLEKLYKGEHEKFSLVALANESGFKSYTSLYRVFKRKHGVSPRNFLDRLEK